MCMFWIITNSEEELLWNSSSAEKVVIFKKYLIRQSISYKEALEELQTSTSSEKNIFPKK